MDEVTFFQYEDVRVTNSRFIVEGQTFAMSNITSVKSFKQSPNRLVPILMLLVGLVFLSSEKPSVGIGLVLVGAAWLYLQKTIYHVMLHTAGGETSALRTHQEVYVGKVVDALNNAIVHRG